MGDEAVKEVPQDIPFETIMDKFHRETNSSYVRVYVAITRLPKGREIWEKGASYFRSLRITGQRFKVTGPDNAVAIYALAHSDSYHTIQDIRDYAAGGYRHFNSENTVNDKEAGRHLYDCIREKLVPTYGCEYTRMLGPELHSEVAFRLSDENRKKAKKLNPDERYVPWLKTAIWNAFAGTRARVVQDMENHVKAVESSPEFAEALKKAVLDTALKEIKDVMSKYAVLGDDVLRRGIQEYVTSSVMDL